MVDDAPPFYMVCAFRSTMPPESKSDQKPEFIEVTFMAVTTKAPKILEKDFHAFVLPTVNQKLTEECKKSCQIKQFNIDHAESWTVVMENLQKWMKGHGLTEDNFKLVIDGTYDFERDLRSQSDIAKWKIPYWATNWIDLRQVFRNVYDEDEIEISKLNMKKMLEIAKIKFDGTDINGHDEAFYLSMIVVNLLRKNPSSISTTEPKLKSNSNSDSDWKRERQQSAKQERPPSVRIERPDSSKKERPDSTKKERLPSAKKERPHSAKRGSHLEPESDPVSPKVEDDGEDALSQWN